MCGRRKCLERGVLSRYRGNAAWGAFQWMSLDYSIGLFDIMETAEWGCQSLQRQCHPRVFGWFQPIPKERGGARMSARALRSSSATQWATPRTPAGFTLKAYFQTPAWKSNLAGSLCRVAPHRSSYRRRWEAPEARREVSRLVDTSLSQGAAWLAGLLVSLRKPQLAHTASASPTLTPPLAFN